MIEINLQEEVVNEGIKIFIVDDSKIVRGHLKERLAEIDKVHLIGEAENARTASEMLASLAPDVVILDIRMPDDSGMSVLKELQKKEPVPIVIIYTSFGYPQYRESYVKAGADHFFDKNLDTEELMDVIVDIREKKLSQPSLSTDSKDDSEQTEISAAQ